MRARVAQAPSARPGPATETTPLNTRLRVKSTPHVRGQGSRRDVKVPGQMSKAREQSSESRARPKARGQGSNPKGQGQMFKGLTVIGQVFKLRGHRP